MFAGTNLFIIIIMTISGLDNCHANRLRLLNIPQPLPNVIRDTRFPSIYVVTPIHRRPEQVADLTRLAHTLVLVPNIYWIVVEDSHKRSATVMKLLIRSGIIYRHLNSPTPDKYKRMHETKPKLVSALNKGLEFVRANARDGVIYFAESHNSYDVQIFREIRYTKKVSMFPVGLIRKLGLSSPILVNGSFVGFYDPHAKIKKFAVDLAGFAVSVKFLQERPDARFPYKTGYEVDGFLKSLHPFEPEQAEFLAKNCTKVWVWRTETKKPPHNTHMDVSFRDAKNSNIAILHKQFW